MARAAVLLGERPGGKRREVVGQKRQVAHAVIEGPADDEEEIQVPFGHGLAGAIQPAGDLRLGRPRALHFHHLDLPPGVKRGRCG